MGQTWENSKHQRDQEIGLLNDFGEQQYWFDATTGELVEYVVLRKTKPNTVPGTPDILFFRKFTVEERNVSYEESKKIIRSLFGKREGEQFNSREDLLRDYQVTLFIPERSYTRFYITLAVNLGIILAFLLIRWYLSKNKQAG